MNFSAVILAGGKSSRMGCDKAFLKIGGQTLLARQIQLAREAGAAEIFISGCPGTNYSAFERRVLLDKFPDAGPLTGIESALDAATTSSLLVLAIDLPEMTAEFLQRLAGGCSETCGVIPKLSGHIEPLVAIYPKSTHALAMAQLENGCFAVKDFAGQCVRSGLARFVEPPASEAIYFANWNLPADLPCTT
ncbi:MAG TPA: molybdenum cofactor guanylyltransferase [Methylomirabilota bacterium]|nr:molybdenum cofactor guanylyltransferase [Methylomirabilota bacterium]